MASLAALEGNGSSDKVSALTGFVLRPRQVLHRGEASSLDQMHVTSSPRVGAALWAESYEPEERCIQQVTCIACGSRLLLA